MEFSLSNLRARLLFSVIEFGQRLSFKYLKYIDFEQKKNAQHQFRHEPHANRIPSCLTLFTLLLVKLTVQANGDLLTVLRRTLYVPHINRTYLAE